MKNIPRRITSLFLIASIIFFANVSLVHSQQTTLVAPSNITIRGISIADYNHTMCVGDSATIMINQGGILADYSFKFTLLPSPVSRNHTFYGISYYDSLHAIIVGDNGLIFTTSDMGQTWMQQAKDLTNVTLRAISQISGNAFQIVGDAGTMLRSTDNGLSWNQVASGTTKALYAESFGSANVGLVVGEKGTILKTTDGGLTWNLQTQAGILSKNYYGVAMKGEDTATAVGDSMLIRYTDDGTTWKTRRDSALSNQRLLVPALRYETLRAVVYTGLSGIPDNNGLNGAAFALGDADYYYYLLNHYTFGKNSVDTVFAAIFNARNANAQAGYDPALGRYTCAAVRNSGNRILIVFAGPYGEIYASGSTSTRWFTWGENPFHRVYQNFFNASFDNLGFGYATASGGNTNTGTVFRTTDNGMTWNSVLFGNSIAGVYCKDSNNAFISGWDGELIRTTNGGVNWDSIPQISQYWLHAFTFSSPDTGFCVGDGGTILRTIDAGASWQDKSPGIPITMEAAAFSSPHIGVVVGENGTLIRTTDGGDNWTENLEYPLAGTSANLKYVQAFPDEIYYIGADSAVMKSTDNGQSWAILLTPPVSGGISFYNSKAGIIGKYSTATGAIPDSMTLIYTNDGGKNWSKDLTVPFFNRNELLAHWLDDCSFLLYGVDGFIMKVSFCGINAVTEIISPASPPLKVFPNPSVQKNVTIDYQTEKDGQVTIALYDELGKQIAALYSGYEVQGHHEQVLILDPNLHGTFFIRADEAGKVQTLRMIKL